MFGSSTFGNQSKYNVNGSIELSDCPNDSINKVWYLDIYDFMINNEIYLWLIFRYVGQWIHH